MLLKLYIQQLLNIRMSKFFYIYSEPVKVKEKIIPIGYSAIVSEKPKTSITGMRMMNDHPCHSLFSRKENFDWKSNLLDNIKNEMSNFNSEKLKMKASQRRNNSNVFNNYDFDEKNNNKKLINKQTESLFSKKKQTIDDLNKGKKCNGLKNSSVELISKTLFGGKSKKVVNSGKSEQITKNQSSIENTLNTTNKSFTNKNNENDIKSMKTSAYTNVNNKTSKKAYGSIRVSLDLNTINYDSNEKTISRQNSLGSIKSQGNFKNLAEKSTVNHKRCFTSLN